MVDLSKVDGVELVSTYAHHNCKDALNCSICSPILAELKRREYNGRTVQTETAGS